MGVRIPVSSVWASGGCDRARALRRESAYICNDRRMDSGLGFVVALAILGGAVLVIILAVLGVLIFFGVRREERRRRVEQTAWRKDLDREGSDA